MAQQLSNQRIAWFNGKFMPENQVMIPFRDRSWKYGDGAFDMTRTFEGTPFRLKEHIDRFYRSLRYLQIDPGISPKEMIANSEAVVEKNERNGEPTQRQANAARRAQTAADREKVRQIEAAMEKLQAIIVDLDEKLSRPGLFERSPDKAAEMAKARATAEERLLLAEEAWLEASAALEEASS